MEIETLRANNLLARKVLIQILKDAGSTTKFAEDAVSITPYGTTPYYLIRLKDAASSDIRGAEKCLGEMGIHVLARGKDQPDDTIAVLYDPVQKLLRQGPDEDTASCRTSDVLRLARRIRPEVTRREPAALVSLERQADPEIVAIRSALKSVLGRGDELPGMLITSARSAGGTQTDIGFDGDLSEKKALLRTLTEVGFRPSSRQPKYGVRLRGAQIENLTRVLGDADAVARMGEDYRVFKGEQPALGIDELASWARSVEGDRAAPQTRRR